MDQMDTGSAMSISYTSTEAIKTLKHDKDVCRTNKPSTRSDMVKDKSLDDLISERKIIVPASRWQDKGNKGYRDRDGVDDDVNVNNGHLSMDQRRNKRFQETVFDFDAVGAGDAMNMSLDSLINKTKKKAVTVTVERDDSKVGMSLNEIIEGQESQNGEGRGGRGQKRKREEEEDIYVMTPLEVIEKLTNKDGLIIEQEIAKQSDHGLGRSHNWRATIKCGELSLTVEATFKDLARQSAAFEIIKIMRGIDPEHLYPKCVIPEGCFYDNVITTKLEEVTQQLGLETPRFEIRQLCKHNRDFFSTTYFVGEDEFQGHSHIEEHSKLFAAKAAYETYAQKKWPREQYHVTEQESKATAFRFHESETVHAMSVAARAAHLPQIELGVPPLCLPEPESADEDELLIDDCGRLYARSSDGSNKIRRLMKLQDLCPDQVVLPTKKQVEAPRGLRGDISSLYDQVPSMDEDELDYGEDL